MIPRPRLLVTRAEPDAQILAKRIQALGGEAILAPLRSEVPVFDIPTLLDPDAVIATSSRAFRLGVPVPPAWLVKPCLVVGPATGEAARAAGFQTVLVGAEHARALATKICAWNPPFRRIVYLAGLPRKAEIEARIAEAGIALDIWLRYRMERLKLLPEAAEQALKAGKCDGVLHWSAESAVSYARLITQAGLEREGWQPVHFCFSAAIAAELGRFAQNSGYEPEIEICPELSGERLVEMAIRHARPRP
jgi:uroporphyrinogen-III synthase